MPAEQGNSNGIQLWINLPKKLKQIDPSYQQVNASDFPVIDIEGGQVKVLVGEGSAIKLNTEVIYQHITLNEQSVYSLNLTKSMRGIVYLLKGKLNIDNKELISDQAMFIEEKNQFDLKAKENSEFMLIFGMPHNEPINQHGPFVD